MSTLNDWLAARRQVAEAASPGPWVAVDDTDDPEIGFWWVHGRRGNVTTEPLARDALHIAGMDPTTTLLLLDVVQMVDETLDKRTMNPSLKAALNALAAHVGHVGGRDDR